MKGKWIRDLGETSSPTAVVFVHGLLSDGDTCGVIRMEPTGPSSFPGTRQRGMWASMNPPITATNLQRPSTWKRRRAGRNPASMPRWRASRARSFSVVHSHGRIGTRAQCRQPATWCESWRGDGLLDACLDRLFLCKGVRSRSHGARPRKLGVLRESIGSTIEVSEPHRHGLVIQDANQLEHRLVPQASRSSNKVVPPCGSGAATSPMPSKPFRHFP